MTEWLPIIQSVGIPSAILMMFAYAAWKIVPWIGNNAVIPVVKAHLDLLAEVKKDIAEETVVLRQAGANLEQVGKDIGQVASAQTSLVQSMATFSESAAKVMEKLNGGK